MAEIVEEERIEVWLRYARNDFGLECTVVNNDESTGELDVESRSMRGAQREMTGWFIRRGYAPVGRWTSTAVEAPDNVAMTTLGTASVPIESFRRFDKVPD
jgi:hypothetical protein